MFSRWAPSASPARRNPFRSKRRPSPAPEVKAEAKTPEENRLHVEYGDDNRTITAYYPNASQGRLKISEINRYDAEIAKPRIYFILELSGAGMIEPLKLDADDAPSLEAVIGIFERFRDRAEKSGGLKVAMARRKADAEAELSREETRLVELQSAAQPSPRALVAAKKRIEELKRTVMLSVEVGAMNKISGVIGAARLNLDHPVYDYVATFEPAKELYTLRAGNSFQIAAKDVTFFVDLLKRTREFKADLLQNEAKTKLLSREVDDIFSGKK